MSGSVHAGCSPPNPNLGYEIDYLNVWKWSTKRLFWIKIIFSMNQVNFYHLIYQPIFHFKQIWIRFYCGTVVSKHNPTNFRNSVEWSICFLESVQSHSMARANLNKSGKFLKNITAASQHIPIEIPPFKILLWSKSCLPMFPFRGTFTK